MSLSKILGRDPAEAGDRARDAGDWRKAAKHYGAAVKADPSKAAIWVQYGHSLKETGRFKEAEAAYGSAVERDGGNADTHLQVGHVLKVQGKLPEAMAAYDRAVQLDPTNFDATREKAALAEILGSADALRTTRGKAKRTPESNPTTVFDCSDLIQYFRDNRLPTGIQRVQINIISEYIRLMSDAVVIFYDLVSRRWCRIGHLEFYRLINTAQNVGAVPDQAWRSVFNQICVESTREYNFVRGDVLVNLGTSWWIPDYFLMIRTLKHSHGIRYMPFVHDCIPLVTPEYCSEGLVDEFRDWLASMLRHADAYLVNSSATSADLGRFARNFGHEIAEPTIIRLDGDVRRGGSFDEDDCAEAGLADLFMRERMPADSSFVLMVSTLEARKNHILALRLWDRMISELGESATPYLLCVGKSGWRFTETQEFLASRKHLARRVRFVSNLGDDILATLYRSCLFTLYPSHYEGWGLPVTESLCFGKVPVVSRNSSLTEAGGEFAEYFEPDFLGEAYAAVTRLISKASYRTSREQEIKTRFVPRSWDNMAREVMGAVEALRRQERKSLRSSLQAVRPGVLHIMAPPASIPADRGISGADLRIGSGWYRCENWGVWTTGPEGHLLIALPNNQLRECNLYLGVRASPFQSVTLKVICQVNGYEGRFEISAGEDRNLLLRLGDVPTGTETLELLLCCDAITDLTTWTDASDRRTVGVGLRWLAIAERADISARLDLMETLGLIDFAPEGRVSAPKQVG